MSPSAAAHCPECNADLAPDLLVCGACGAEVAVWADSARTPLILPGNPALSADVVRKRASVPRIVGGAVLALGVLGAVVFTLPEDDDSDPQAPRAVATEIGTSQPPAVAAAADLTIDSLSARTYGDTALSRPVDDGAARAAAAPVAAAASAVLEPIPSVPPPPVAAVPVAAPTPVRPTTAISNDVEPTRPAAAPTVTPVLRLAPLASNVLQPGDRLRLDWTVADRATRREIPGRRVEFTSTDSRIIAVNARTGAVRAVAPGTARVIIDAGIAGTRSVQFTVRSTAAPTVANLPTPVMAAPARASTGTQAEGPRTPMPTASAETPRSEVPSADEVRAVVDRFVREVRRDAVRNVDVNEFLSDGADHRVTMVNGPSTLGTSGAAVRVAFDLRFTKFDGGGRPVTRIASVTMDVDKRAGPPASSAVAIGPLRRP